MRCNAGIDGFVDLQGLGPDWDMLSRGQFISNLLDAAEHATPTVQVRQVAEITIIYVCKFFAGT